MRNLWLLIPVMLLPGCIPFFQETPVQEIVIPPLKKETRIQERVPEPQLNLDRCSFQTVPVPEPKKIPAQPDEPEDRLPDGALPDPFTLGGDASPPIGCIELRKRGGDC